MLKGNIVALITPYTKDGNINFLKIKQLIEFQYFSGTEGIVILGTTGEASTISDLEKEELVKYVVKENAERMKVVVGVSENNTLQAIKKATLYESLGVDYLLVLTPFYNKSNDEGVYEHFKEVANSVSIPIILYNVPSRTGLNISIDVLKRLKQIPNIIGIKEATSDINHIIEVSNVCDHYFHMYGGNDELSYVFLSLNATGLINVVGNYNPNILFILIKKFEENPYLAYEYYKSIYPFLKSLTILLNSFSFFI